MQGNKKCASVAHYGIELPCLPCMALRGLVWPYVALCGLMWPRMVLMLVLTAMTMYGLVWPCMALHDLAWTCMAFYGLKWHFMVFYGRISSSLAVIDPNSFGLVWYVKCLTNETPCSSHKPPPTETFDRYTQYPFPDLSAFLFLMHCKQAETFALSKNLNILHIIQDQWWRLFILLNLP